MTPQSPSLWHYVNGPCTTVANNLDATDFSEIKYTYSCDPTNIDGGCYYGVETDCIPCTDDYDCPYQNYGSCNQTARKCQCTDPQNPYGDGPACSSKGKCSNSGYVSEECPPSPPNKRLPTALVECTGILQGPSGDDLKTITDVMRKFCSSMAQPAATSGDKEL